MCMAILAPYNFLRFYADVRKSILTGNIDLLTSSPLKLIVAFFFANALMFHSWLIMTDP
ncbi:hypothetical protein BGZ94_005841, partial [Podila epigama]